MKILSLLLLVAYAKHCKNNQWHHKGKCVKMVDFAFENKNLPAHATTFAKKFYDYLDEGDVVKQPVKLLERFKATLKKALAWSSFRKRKGKEHCLKDDVTQLKLDAIEKIANDDYEYSGGPLKGMMRIDHAEQYLENLNHLLFKADCPARTRLQTRIDKLFHQLEKLCKKQCSALGFDYFYHVEGGPNFFQNYHDEVDHSESASILGEEVKIPVVYDDF